MTLPDRMHLVHTLMRRGAPSIIARTRCRLGYQRRFVLLLAWLTLCPKTGPLPQISHTRAIGHYIRKYVASATGIRQTANNTSNTLLPQPQ